MSNLVNAFDLNAKHVINEIKKAAEQDFEDPHLVKTAANERIQRAKNSLEVLRGSLIEDQDLISFAIEVTSEGASKKSLFSARPTAEALLMMLGTQVKDGDTVTTTATFTHGKRSVTDTWPISLGSAAEMVSDISMPKRAPDANGNTTKRASFRVGKLGQLSIKTVSGPPLWKMPKVRLKTKELDTGERQSALMLGWRRKAVILSWQK